MHACISANGVSHVQMRVDCTEGEVCCTRRACASLYQVGDWGRLGQYNQTQVAALMGQKADISQPDFIISTGDNFYPSERSAGNLGLKPHSLSGSKGGLVPPT